MTFFKQQSIGRVYMIKLILPDGQIVHKIGMVNSNRAVDRMMEILRSWFMHFRFVPYSELRLDMETGYPKELEAHIHRILAHKQFNPGYKVSGSTEMFAGIDEFRVIHYLRKCQDALFESGIELTDSDYAALGNLISP